MNTTLFTQKSINKPTLKRTLLMSMIAMSMGGMGVSAQAQTAQNSQQEIEQLRQEVQALRALVEQQQKQTATLNTAVQTQQAAAASAKPVMKLASGAEFNLYGNVRADASYQAEGGSSARMYNQINTVPLEGVGERSDEFKSTLSATRLGMDFKAPVGAGDKALSGKIEVDFLGGDKFDNLRIRHAYMSYANWLIGQTWSNFAVPDYLPETVDALAYAGGSIKRTPQVRYTSTFSPATNLVLAVEDPKDATITGIKQRLPALTARLNHKFADNLSVSARAMGNEKRVKEDEEMAWGVGLGAKYEVVPGTTLKADYYHVKGDSSFVTYANKGVVADITDNLYQSEFDSISVGITQQFNDKLRGTLGYGYMSFDQDAGYIDALSADDKTKTNKDLWQAWANVFYSPTKPLSFGLEYVYGERKALEAATNGSDTGVDNRINAVAIYNF
ncbi:MULTISPECIES: DcaP family trimeric outer membrane transporter [Acinetobacter]|uniref:DcaP family trimeric outer membrane transporter n=1 Tax=Acinetobacter faecalis TaxID=2665161 RepID=A0A6L6GJR5_9GAMM|nr:MULTISPECIES: DcaP family trimeric outer membrane transporter [Acinetobacter]MDY6462628.1 DcaP family trimeric outer membrane transporter [Acinetobacter faecalis]MDY6485163.1 DcaP family trimeric outer membrane transporter [Acinetobacter faecalis]MDY6487295.1 DcaP family trimeric outer membrane transporter [Acinetobacter faecalis]MDY6490051.1 DcaP family trimeric outer membrane transporter [Acinetobacter faecalis]MDY6531188.1 DcaP family trimeric outer membrane transporter [Acinetobacter fa